ncbi:class I SAM-dependent methyltransferase [Thiocystis violacea]|uniref:class I SAM-dependent methyltransferase n=1 Tax=Thiocystis violacea TaxID=13725 RepID=UPI001908343C|nr:class I SAM-dependent methyltransferase [Thiocystis violacea]
MDFPALSPEHVEGARLFATRHDMIKAIAPRHGLIAEVGVAFGDFSEFLITELRPARFFALDLFDLDQYETVWGRPSAECFGNRSHLDYYRSRFAHLSDLVEIEVGPSRELLAGHADESLDLIYIDAGHSYEEVKADAAQAARKVKPSGQLIFNDYTLSDPFSDVEYGVVQAVNELLEAGGWRVLGFALDRRMFCDMALVRS